MWGFAADDLYSVHVYTHLHNISQMGMYHISHLCPDTFPSENPNCSIHICHKVWIHKLTNHLLKMWDLHIEGKF